MNYTPETNDKTWTKQEWKGNPSLNLQCSCKLFAFQSRKIPVWVFGGTKEYPTFTFCVNAGANSDYSYSGATGCTDIESAENYVDGRHKSNTLIR